VPWERRRSGDAKKIPPAMIDVLEHVDFPHFLRPGSRERESHNLTPCHALSERVDLRLRTH
jgi:hypothetical protein